MEIIEKIKDLGFRVETLLTGEPARFIYYGAAIVVWLVILVANAVGFTKLGPNISLTDALVQATLAGAALTELIRRYVYSPNTTADIAVDAYLRGAETATRDAAADVPPAPVTEPDA